MLVQIIFFSRKKMVLCVAKFPVSYPFTSIYIFDFFIFGEYKNKYFTHFFQDISFYSLSLLKISHISAGNYQKKSGGEKTKQMDHYSLDNSNNLGQQLQHAVACIPNKILISLSRFENLI